MSCSSLSFEEDTDKEGREWPRLATCALTDNPVWALLLNRGELEEPTVGFTFGGATSLYFIGIPACGLI